MAIWPKSLLRCLLLLSCLSVILVGVGASPTAFNKEEEARIERLRLRGVSETRIFKVMTRRHAKIESRSAPPADSNTLSAEIIGRSDLLGRQPEHEDFEDLATYQRRRRALKSMFVPATIALVD
ncbi:MAG: hypothetical protein M1827_004493 [Pycnora praestabilis]|nr:MAG: hypothetical protein M1827_004493 [Pycnora praestabilis]